MIFGISIPMIFTILFFNETLSHKVLCTLLYCLGLIISDSIATSLVVTVRQSISWSTILNPSVDRIITFSISKIIAVLLVSILIYFKKNNKKYLPFKYWFIFLLVFSMLLIMMLLLMDVGVVIESNSRVNSILIVMTIMMLFFYFLMYYLFFNICTYFEKLNEIQLINYQKETIQKYFLQKKESDKVIKILSHDLKHHLILWKKLATTKEYKKLLEDIILYEEKFEDIKLVDVKNYTANAIINEKLIFAKNHDIFFQVKGEFYEDLIISDLDLCSLLGNMLDNAIEANMKKKDKNDAHIVLDLKRKGKFLIIQLENNCYKAPKQKNNIFMTDKKDKEVHGIGTMSINEIVEKYEGVIENTFQDNIFKSIIMIKGYGSIK